MSGNAVRSTNFLLANLVIVQYICGSLVLIKIHASKSLIDGFPLNEWRRQEQVSTVNHIRPFLVWALILQVIKLCQRGPAKREYKFITIHFGATWVL